ncbi:MAG: cold shock domain-containing protein [Chryseosolibacter sp.]
MAKSQETWNKKENEKKRLKKKKDKEARKEERKASGKEKNSFEIAYVDEYGNFSSTPPDPKNKVAVNEADIQISVPKYVGPSKTDLIRKGIVTFFNDSKGYGFIKDMDTQESVFVHINGLIDPIKENNKVTFEVEMGHKGPNAVRVKLVR